MYPDPNNNNDREMVVVASQEITEEINLNEIVKGEPVQEVQIENMGGHKINPDNPLLEITEADTFIPRIIGLSSRDKLRYLLKWILFLGPLFAAIGFVVQLYTIKHSILSFSHVLIEQGKDPINIKDSDIFKFRFPHFIVKMILTLFIPVIGILALRNGGRVRMLKCLNCCTCWAAFTMFINIFFLLTLLTLTPYWMEVAENCDAQETCMVGPGLKTDKEILQCIDYTSDIAVQEEQCDPLQPMFVQCEPEHDDHHGPHHGPHGHHECPMRHFRKFWHAFRLLTSPMHHTDMHHLFPIHHPGHHMEDPHGMYLLRGEPHFWTGAPPPPPPPHKPVMEFLHLPPPPPSMENNEEVVQVEIFEIEKPQQQEGEFYNMKIMMIVNGEENQDEEQLGPRRLTEEETMPAPQRRRLIPVDTEEFDEQRRHLEAKVMEKREEWGGLYPPEEKRAPRRKLHEGHHGHHGPGPFRHGRGPFRHRFPGPPMPFGRKPHLPPSQDPKCKLNRDAMRNFHLYVRAQPELMFYLMQAYLVALMMYSILFLGYVGLFSYGKALRNELLANQDAARQLQFTEDSQEIPNVVVASSGEGFGPALYPLPSESEDRKAPLLQQQVL